MVCNQKRAMEKMGIHFGIMRTTILVLLNYQKRSMGYGSTMLLVYILLGARCLQLLDKELENITHEISNVRFHLSQSEGRYFIRNGAHRTITIIIIHQLQNLYFALTSLELSIKE
jgi:hypothetical protein